MHRRKILFLFTLVSLCASFLYVTVVNKNSGFDSTVQSNYLQADIVVRFDEDVSTLEHRECHPGDLVYENYCVITPEETQRNAPGDAGIVTLCTQGTLEFLHHVAVVCRRWTGPMSVAVYSPADDYEDARWLVDMMRECDFCVRYWVTWHFFYPKGPAPVATRTPNAPNCSAIMSEKPKKRRSQGTYPINVGRNLARIRSQTTYVFSTDIELYPSIGILAKFERMLLTEPPPPGRQVWVLPVFEVGSKYRAPMTKPELKEMFRKRQAISFHQFRCNMCHRIPNLTQWLNLEDWTSEVNDTLTPLKVFTTVNRSRHFRLQFWEPFFIGTKNDPEFDIRLSWEGKQNKMQLAYEMCLQQYRFHIVANGFLVHAPGINVFNATKDKLRDKYVAQNNKVIAKIKKELLQKYGRTNGC